MKWRDAWNDVGRDRVTVPPKGRATPAVRAGAGGLGSPAGLRCHYAVWLFALITLAAVPAVAQETQPDAAPPESSQAEESAAEESQSEESQSEESEAEQSQSEQSQSEEPDESPDLIESESVVDGQPRRISDWALAGMLWSDAHLVRKLAQHASQRAAKRDDTERVRGLRDLQQDCDQIINVLGRFGWQELRAPSASASPQPASSAADPAAAGRNSATVQRPEKLAARAETETPPGANDPGVDDELLPDEIDFDLERYRVDDYIDETEREAGNLADAIEDGAEGALAAGIDNLSGSYGVGAAEARMSRRELSTRSNTLPYSKDSIYDTDDFDPDVDYDVNDPLLEPIPSDSNPLIERAEEGESGTERDRPATLEGNRVVDAPAAAAGAASANVDDVENENDLVDALLDQDPDAVAAEEARTPSPTGPADVRRFTEQGPSFRQDAAWVQLHFDVNDQIWQMLPTEATDEHVRRMLDAAILRLQAHARVAQPLVEADRLHAAFRIIGDQ